MQIRAGTRWLSLLATGLIAVSLAACGDDDDESGAPAATTESTTKQTQSKPSGGTKLDIDAVENGAELSFSKEKLTAKAGQVTVSMRNPSGNQLPHAVEVEGNGVEEESDTVQAGDSSTVTVDLKPGKYVFYCPVGSHREQGMEGTLTVR
jgi:plastocyanin